MPRREALTQIPTEALLAGPPVGAFRGHYVIGLATQLGPTELHFFDAWYTRFPNHSEPEYMLLWTPASAHVFRYTDIEYFYKGA